MKPNQNNKDLFLLFFPEPKNKNMGYVFAKCKHKKLFAIYQNKTHLLIIYFFKSCFGNIHIVK